MENIGRNGFHNVWVHVNIRLLQSCIVGLSTIAFVVKMSAWSSLVFTHLFNYGKTIIPEVLSISGTHDPSYSPKNL